jgi:hypothetical protein
MKETEVWNEEDGQKWKRRWERIETKKKKFGLEENQEKWKIDTMLELEIREVIKVMEENAM